MEPIHSLPRRDTQPYQLLELIAISGDFPADLLLRLPGGGSYKESVVKMLKKDRLIRTFYRDRLRTFRLTAPAKSLLTADQPDRFSFYLTGNADTNLLKGEITRRLRLYQIATIYINMALAGIHIFRDDKPDVFAPSGCQVSALSEAAFYSSREIKNMGLDATKIRGSRMTGVLLSASGIHIIYNSGNSLMKWETRAELRVKALMQMELCQRRLSGQYRRDDISAVLFGDNMDLVHQILTGSKASKQNYFVLDGNYDHFYFLTNDHRGEVLLKLLCDTSRIAELNCILSEGLNSRSANWHIENDAFDQNEEPVLFGYFLDMPRIARFNAASELRGQSGTLICFDFQSETLRQYCNSRVRVKTIDFTKFERRFFP